MEPVSDASSTKVTRSSQRSLPVTIDLLASIAPYSYFENDKKRSEKQPA